MNNGGPVHADFPLSDEQRMLVQIRDALYEGSWEDFLADLRARAESRPHVFETVPTSPAMKSTIARHVSLIDEMRRWEGQHGRPIQAGAMG